MVSCSLLWLIKRLSQSRERARAREMPWLWYPDPAGQPTDDVIPMATDGIPASVLAAADQLRDHSLSNAQAWVTTDRYRKRRRDPTERINTAVGTVEARYTLLRAPQMQGEGATWKVAYCLITQEDTRILRPFYLKKDGEMVLIPAKFVVYQP